MGITAKPSGGKGITPVGNAAEGDAIRLFEGNPP